MLPIQVESQHGTLPLSYSQSLEQQIGANGFDESGFHNSTPQAERQMDWFVSRLRLFVVGVTFDYKEFATQAPQLSIRLTDLVFWARKVPPSSRLLEQVAFARKVFIAMLESAADLSFYDDTGGDQVLLRSMTQLNIGLFFLYDSRGVPDPLKYGYANTVKRLKRLSTYMGELFEELDDVPFRVRHAFETQFFEAKDKLRVLEQNVLGEDEEP